jgi:hypothetical protein
MNPKKQKEKDRRRARKLADEAWEAASTGNLDLAEKIIRRAVAAQEDNPVIWNDQGVLLARRQKVSEAAESFRCALSLAPTYAEPYAHLAAIRIRQGFANEAVALQTQAVKHAPQNHEFAKQLQVYLTVAGKQPTALETAAGASPVIAPPNSTDTPANWAAEVETLDWHNLGERFTRDGLAVIADLVDMATCANLSCMFDEDHRFAKTVVMDRAEFGIGVYRYFAAPIPAVVDQLRKAIYPHVARIANIWQQQLGELPRFPATWDAFRDECHQAGQTTPTPLLLKYGPGGFNALHRDLRGAVYFPVQMAIVLSPRRESSDSAAEGFEGGEFLLCDFPNTEKSRRKQVVLNQGDAVLFCTRDRLVRVGSTYGLQPVKHGVAPIMAGTRFVLGVPFHEYR